MSKSSYRHIVVLAAFSPELLLALFTAKDFHSHNCRILAKVPAEAHRLLDAGFTYAGVITYEIMDRNQVEMFRVHEITLLEGVPENQENKIVNALKALAEDALPRRFGWVKAPSAAT